MTATNLKESTMTTKNTTSKAQQARELTGRQEGSTLNELRSAILIAHHNGDRVYWPKSVYPTLEAASDALEAAGLPAGLAFTQYRAKGGFANLLELLPAAPAAEVPAEAPKAKRKGRKAVAEAATTAEANEAADAVIEARAPRTTCKRGHDLTDDANVIVWASAGNARRCKACYDLKRASQKVARDERKAAEKAAEAAAEAKKAEKAAAAKTRRAAKKNAAGGTSETVYATKEAALAAAEAPAEA